MWSTPDFAIKSEFAVKVLRVFDRSTWQDRDGKIMLLHSEYSWRTVDERCRSPSGGGSSVHPRSGRSAAWVHRFVRTFPAIFQAVANEFLSRTQIRKDSSDVVVKRSCQLVLRVSNLLDDRIILHRSVPRKALLACISWASQIRPNDTS